MIDAVVVRPEPSHPSTIGFGLEESGGDKAPERLTDQPPVDPRGPFYPQTQLLKDRLPPLADHRRQKPAVLLDQILGKEAVNQFHAKMPLHLEGQLGLNRFFPIIADHGLPHALNLRFERLHKSIEFPGGK